MLRLYRGIIPKVVSPRFTTLNWGRGGDEVCSVNVHQLSNLGWIVSRVMTKIVTQPVEISYTPIVETNLADKGWVIARHIANPLTAI